METENQKPPDCWHHEDKCDVCGECRDPCQVYEGDKPCGETETLKIVKQFRDLYEKKLQQIESTGGGDCAQAQVS